MEFPVRFTEYVHVKGPAPEMTGVAVGVMVLAKALPVMPAIAKVTNTVRTPLYACLHTKAFMADGKLFILFSFSHFRRSAATKTSA